MPPLLAPAWMENFRLLSVFVCRLVEQEFIAIRHKLIIIVIVDFFILSVRLIIGT
jgi:hypothetical protein